MLGLERCSSVGDLLLDPAVETTLDGKAETGSNAAKAGLVLVTTALAIRPSANGAHGAVAPVLEPRCKSGKADSSVVRAAASARGEETADGRGAGYGGVH